MRRLSRHTIYTDPAFTLIELLIVIAIIAILALIAVPNFLEAQTRSKVSRSYADIRVMRDALETYHIDHGAYPVDSGGDQMYSWSLLTTPIAYLTIVPMDPFVNEPAPYDYGGVGVGPDSVGGFPLNVFIPRGVWYYIISPGPSRRFDFGDTYGALSPHERIARGPDSSAVFLYSPTNGTMSYGDLVATNKSFYNAQ